MNSPVEDHFRDAITNHDLSGELVFTTPRHNVVLSAQKEI